MLIQVVNCASDLLFMLGFSFSFQTLWTKFQTILESNVKTRMVSVTFIFPDLSCIYFKVVKDCQALRGNFCFLLVCGPVEADPEYKLIVAANNLTVEIDNELSEFLKHFLKHFCHQH